MSKTKKSDVGKFVRIDRRVADEISSFLFALGNEFVSAKNANGAFDCFKYSVDLNPKNHSSVHNLGALYSATGNFEGAYKMFKEATRMDGNNLQAKIALAEVARKIGRVDEAWEILDAVYKLDPENYLAMSAIAILQYDLGRLAEAMEWNSRALEKRPGDLHMVLNRTLINMTYGLWEDNWEYYEYCLSYQKNEKMRNLNMADAWGGQELEGQTLLVISDQGSGDAVQFSRYLAEAKAKGKFAKLIYLVQPDLKSLVERVDGIDMVIGFGERMRVDYDSYSSLLGIMRVLKVSPASCYRPPHIKTEQRLNAVWEARIRAKWDGQSKKVGIVWAGDPRHGNDHARSISLNQFLKILYGFGNYAPVDNTQLFSFQVGAGTEQLSSAPVDDAWEVVELGSEFRSFDDTASALLQMDLLISCDTSVAHLAGCLGVPTWLLASTPPEWRWLTDVATTEWYRNMRLYRQSTPKNWDSVFDTILRDLHEFASGDFQ